MNDGTLVNGTNNVMVELMKKLMCDGWMMAKDFQLEVRTHYLANPFCLPYPRGLFPMTQGYS